MNTAESDFIDLFAFLGNKQQVRNLLSLSPQGILKYKQIFLLLLQNAFLCCFISFARCRKQLKRRGTGTVPFWLEPIALMLQ